MARFSTDKAFMRGAWLPAFRASLVLWFLLAALPAGEGRALGGQAEATQGVSDWAQLRRALEMLQRTDTGRGLLEQASRSFRVNIGPEVPALEMGKLFRWDQVSRTDAVLTREFDSRTGRESRVREVSIHLKRSQPFADLLFDLAHELTHAVAGPSWDPYDPQLTAAGYILSALEASGGEVDAIVSECRVSAELGPALEGPVSSQARCERYRVAGGQIDREKVREDFYRAGEWYDALKSRLGEEMRRFPLLSDRAPRLYSSTGAAPYPVALIHEYDEITLAACDNSRRRLASRAIATDAARKSAELLVLRRCPASVTRGGDMLVGSHAAPAAPGL